MPIESGSITFPIDRLDARRRLVFGLAYCPPADIVEGSTYSREYLESRVDSYSTFMDQDTLETLAHDFLIQSREIDIEHDGQARQLIEVVESYIVRESTESYPIVGSWVLGVKILDDTIWRMVESGELAGFSIAVRAAFEEVSVYVEQARSMPAVRRSNVDSLCQYVVNRSKADASRVERKAQADREAIASLFRHGKILVPVG